MRANALRSRAGRRVAAVSAAGLVAAGTIVAVAAQSPGAEHQPSAAWSPRPDNASDVWPITECGTFDGRGCAPTRDRVDLVRPTFKNDPTHIDNPLFPVSETDTVVQVGHVDGLPFRSETSTLPQTAVVDWFGTKVPVVQSQYVAYLDGHITEVAIDRYAQADDGSVWYFGEDVIDYQHGGAHLTEGTWLAGRDGPPAMIMPAHPKLGDVFRVENIIGIVFEELTVVQVHKTVAGPNGPVHGAIVVDELGVDGGHSKKTLAPGYGEFLTRDGADLEAMAIATPTDSLPGGVPFEMRNVLTAAWGTLEYARMDEWQAARFSVRRIETKLDIIDKTQQPPRVMQLLRAAVTRLSDAVGQQWSLRTQQATVDAAQSTIDLEARYLPAAEVYVARFHMLTQRLRVDAPAADDHAGVTGDVAAIEWTSQRAAHLLKPDELASFEDSIHDLRHADAANNLRATADIAVRLAMVLRDAAVT